MTRSSILLSLLVLAGCATEKETPVEVDLFSVGTEEELVEAENLAYAQLFDASGPALAKGIDELSTLKVHVDEMAMAHTKVRQLHRGVPVWGSEAIVHLSSKGELAGITDDLLDRVEVDTTPEYSDSEAIDLAVEAYSDGWEDLTEDPRADLWVLRQEGADHLVWRVQLHRVNHRADDSMPVLFVDAHSGELVWSYNNMQSATCSGATNLYGTVSLECYTDGSSYYLEDTSDLLGTYSWNRGTSSLYYVSSTSTTLNSSSAVYKNANEAQYVAVKANSYYESVHGRNGIDGAGGPAYITSHGYNLVTSTTSYGSNYVNAFWDPVNLYMTYGDGDGVTSNSLTTLDIGGHELTHGVTQYEANLTYSGESGGLNEAISDIFGAMVERSVLGETSDTWKVGESTWTPSIAGDASRYMDDPKDDGYSYDYYSSSVGGADVHYSSGIANLAFYLLSEGGSHPRGTSTTVVTAIGADDAADIWYLALTSYMTSSTTFNGARTATLSAASALFGSTSTQYAAVGQSWDAVGVGVAASCTSTTYTGSLSRRAGVYKPTSSGLAVTGTSQTVTLSGPSGTDFDVYLQKKSGANWSTVGTSAGTTSTEAIAYTGTAGTYRTYVYAYSGSGNYTLTWCK